MTTTDTKGFDAAWQEVGERLRTLVRVTYGLIGLTRLGEHPVEADRFAAYLSQPTDAALAALDSSSGALFTPRVHDGLITLDLARPASLRRRHVRIGQRRIAMSGCVPDLFLIAAVLDTPFQVEDTCPATDVPVQVSLAPPDHRPDLVDAVDPVDTVVALDPRLLGQASTLTPEQIDANLCVQMPFYANPDAAATWLAGHPARRACPVHDMHRLEVVGFARDVIRPSIAAHL
jgi:Alkylmercury lyase